MVRETFCQTLYKAFRVRYTKVLDWCVLENVCTYVLLTKPVATDLTRLVTTRCYYVNLGQIQDKNINSM